MITPQSRSSVVVGIDGSQAAIDAAQWAVDEAVDRDIPVRLVYVIDEKSSEMSIELHHAEAALRAATRAVQAMATPVGVETSIIYGSVLEGLAEESKTAVMICVGSVGIGRVAWKSLGSTAASLANTAHCSVAIIRRHAGIRRLRRARLAIVPTDRATPTQLVGHHARRSVLVVPAEVDQRVPTELNTASSSLR